MAKTEWKPHRRPVLAASLALHWPWRLTTSLLSAVHLSTPPQVNRHTHTHTHTHTRTKMMMLNMHDQMERTRHENTFTIAYWSLLFHELHFKLSSLSFSSFATAYTESTISQAHWDKSAQLRMAPCNNCWPISRLVNNYDRGKFTLMPLRCLSPTLSVLNIEIVSSYRWDELRWLWVILPRQAIDTSQHWHVWPATESPIKTDSLSLSLPFDLRTLTFSIAQSLFAILLISIIDPLQLLLPLPFLNQPPTLYSSRPNLEQVTFERIISYNRSNRQFDTILTASELSNENGVNVTIIV